MDNNKISNSMDIEEQFKIPPQVYEQYVQQHHFYFDKSSETALFEGEVMPMVVLNMAQITLIEKAILKSAQKLTPNEGDLFP